MTTKSYMKKIAVAIFAFACTSFATLNAQTITNEFRPANSDSHYATNTGVNSLLYGSLLMSGDILLGNYYALDTYYYEFNLFEFDISADKITTINSIELTTYGSFAPKGSEFEIPSDLKVFTVEIFVGGTGNAQNDYENSKLTSVAKLGELSIADFENGLVKITDLDIDISEETYIAFMISVDGSTIINYEYGGSGISLPGDQLGISISQVIPEPSTYAAIFGTLALGLAICRRRK